MKKSECCPTRFFNGCRTRHSSLAVSFKKVSAECPLPRGYFSAYFIRIQIYTCSLSWFFCLISNSLVFQIYALTKSMIFLLSFYIKNNFKSTVPQNPSFICLLGFKSTLHPKPWFFFCLIHKKPNQHLFISMVFLPYQFFLSISNLHFIQTHDFFA